MIPVVKPYLPDRDIVDAYIDSIYETNWLTNNGPLVQRLSDRLAEYLDIDPDCLVLVANGSLALHLAYKALKLKGEAITTPFSFIATASTLKWEGLQPAFSDIDAETWNIDPALIKEKINANTCAIVPVHVFGNPCDVDAIQKIASKYSLKVIYDASHCFGATLAGQSVLKYGDVSTISFHATKLFHTVEGGAVITDTKELASKIRKMINFGIDRPDSISVLGTNAKMSEFHAAVGLAVLDSIESIKQQRKEVWDAYSEELSKRFQMQKRHPQANNNHAYFPIVLETEEAAVNAITTFAEKGIQARRYFYPSLDRVEGLGGKADCSVSNSIASRILCLPIWSGKTKLDQSYIIRTMQGKVSW